MKTKSSHRAVSAVAKGGERMFQTAAWDDAGPLEMLSTRFALRVLLSLGPRFNLRRDINSVVVMAGRYFVWPEPILERMRCFLARRCGELGAWEGVGKVSLDEFMQRFGAWNGLYDDSSMYYYLDEFVKTNGKDLLSVFQSTVRTFDSRLAGQPIRLIENIEMLSGVLGLSEAERSVLMHASLCKYQRDLRPILVDCKAQSAQEAYSMLGQVLGFEAASIAQALRASGRLDALGLIESPIAEHSITDLGDLMRVSDKLLAVLTAEYRTESSMMAAFTRPAGETALTLDDFPHVDDDARYLIALLSAAAAGQEKGVNILVYGPPGTGKTEFAKLLSQRSGLELYEVDCLDGDGNSLSGRERYRSLQVSQAFLKGRAQASILFDEVEDVFPPIAHEIVGLLGGEDRRGASVNGKAWVNQTLEQNPVPTIWISNSIEQIDPAYRRRFQFHLELSSPPQGVRENIARKYLSELGVGDEFVRKLAARSSITPAQIQSAARFARLAGTRVDDSAEDLITRQLERADKALGGNTGDRGFRVNVTEYDLELLNVECRYPISRVVDALSARPRASLCFYGLPGTGKTALAEHIAKTIDRPLMIRRASDLVSKYVGETEQQMARMFDEATRESAVLLLDEADSFLQDRKGAVRNYEVSEVNEMLQGMERFDGVFICTTNLFERLDEAALRRFAFKLRFLPLLPAQRERMFVSEVLNGDPSLLDPAVSRRLAQLDLLAPGDFAAVKRQFVLLAETPEADTFIEQLEREHAVKPGVRYARSVGFVR